jgi:hypothetical protein
MAAAAAAAARATGGEGCPASTLGTGGPPCPPTFLLASSSAKASFFSYDPAAILGGGLWG